ncbi:hypothetical protein TNCV_4831041 [Trichonephila clavipes]|nr:hypothetical protein TNCV_4831041 [Trichonephila clavipes]
MIGIQCVMQTARSYASKSSTITRAVGGFIMVWAALTWPGLHSLVKLKKSLSEKEYNLQGFMDLIHPKKSIIVQDDNAL